MILNAHSQYSYRYGVLSPTELVDLLLELGYEQAVLADVNSTSGSLDFARLAMKKGLRPLLGVDFRNGARQQFVMIAKSNKGFQHINAYLSFLKAEHKPVPERAPELEDVVVVYPFATFTGSSLDLGRDMFLGVAPSDLMRLRFSPWAKVQEKLVVLSPATFRHQRDFNTHRLLRAIDQNVLLSKLPKDGQAHIGNRFYSRSELSGFFAEYSALIRNTEALLDSCQVHFDFGDDIPHQNKRSYTGDDQADWELIRRLCQEGLSYRYPNPNKKVLDRIETELEIIRQKQFLAYFLISWDICRYARNKGYFYVGRGSGANSVVAYILRITDVDPIELDLYFERFINLFRRNPPDFDLDFSWRDRPDVTRYIFDRFGREYTALVGAYVTFQYRAVIRELGKVFGLPKHEIDRIAENRSAVDSSDSMTQLILKYGKYIHGLPNHLSVHSGGIVISEKPIHWFCATDMPPKGYPTMHIDMVVSEDVGLYKYDILGQRGLGKIKDAIEIVRENHSMDEPIDIHDIPRFKEDEKIKSLLREGQAMGCFYVESPAMRMLLRKLRVEDYLGLVAASSVIRPGVAKSGMMRTYIERFRDPKKRRDAHPVMLDIMPETYGVMVYQEDVIKVAHYFAGLTLAEADVLRRGMSGKYRSRDEFLQVKEKFFSNCIEKGYGESLTNEVWRQVESFAGYAFAKGHSASYAVESYQSLFLKAHYPIEYMVATVNNGGGFYRAEFYLHEARLHGATVEAPCVNSSVVDCSLKGKTIYLGLAFVHEMERTLANRIVSERQQRGTFTHLEDFIDRVPVTMDDIEQLIRIGAFRFCEGNHRKLLWKAHMLLGKKGRQESEISLFKPEVRDFKIPNIDSTREEGLFDQLELLGFPLSDPWLLIEDCTPYELRSDDLPKYLGKVITLQGYLVTAKNTSTTNGKRMYFGTFIDRSGTWLDTVHFPTVADRYPFRGRGVYTVTGRVVEDFGVYSIEVMRMEKEAFISDPRYSEVSVKRSSRLVAETDNNGLYSKKRS